MERELWKSLYRFTVLLDTSPPHWKYTDGDILVTYFWSVVHDRPVKWSSVAENWPDDLRPQALPSQSQVSRRLRTPSIVQLMCQMEDLWLALCGAALFWIHVLDGKPLPVSNVSKDPDASFGRGAGGTQRGYKLHAIWGGGPLPTAWAVAPLNVNESRMARDLLNSLPGSGYVLADTEFDSNILYDIAHESGHQLVVRKRRGNLGHQHHSPWRLRSVELLKTTYGKHLYRYRRQIERDFGNLTSFGGGLIALPPWVRRMNRVRNWVHAKLLTNAVRWFRHHLPSLLALA
jgi:hypothetical protein